LVPTFKTWEPQPCFDAVYRQAVLPLKSTLINERGDYWVGDVAGLFELGRISRRVAEADTAPMKPLTDRPRPFNGYLVRAMETGPSDIADNDHPVLLKGRTHAKVCAFCIYPAERGTP